MEVNASKPSGWLSLDEAVAYAIERLSASGDPSVCTKRFFRRVVAERRLTYYKVRGRLFFRPEDIDAFFESGRVDAIA